MVSGSVFLESVMYVSWVRSYTNKMFPLASGLFLIKVHHTHGDLKPPYSKFLESIAHAMVHYVCVCVCVPDLNPTESHLTCSKARFFITGIILLTHKANMS